MEIDREVAISYTISEDVAYTETALTCRGQGELTQVVLGALG